MLRLLCSGIALLLVSGCASYGVVENKPAQDEPNESYSIKSFMKGWRNKENALILAFSGGGTRAAALSYGVLKELRDTPVVFEGQTKPLLDEVSTISSVSGASCCATIPNSAACYPIWRPIAIGASVRARLRTRDPPPLDNLCDAQP